MSHYIEGFLSFLQEGQSVAEYTQKVMVEDSLISSHPVYQPVDNPSEIDSMFDSITYDKVSLINCVDHSITYDKVIN